MKILSMRSTFHGATSPFGFDSAIAEIEVLKDNKKVFVNAQWCSEYENVVVSILNNSTYDLYESDADEIPEFHYEGDLSEFTEKIKLAYELILNEIEDNSTVYTHEDIISIGVKILNSSDEYKDI